MTEKKIDLLEFGDLLLETRDLDPLYVGLCEARMDPHQLYRWMLAYWCFYHVGAASYISQHKGGAYWDYMVEAAANATSPRIYRLPGDRWPRAAERRHFRGPKCVEAVKRLAARFPKPELAVESLLLPTQAEVMREARTWYLFGRWIGFKMFDMLERVAGERIACEPNIGLLYDEPRAGLELWAEKLGGEARHAEKLYEELLARYAQQAAPPIYDRPCGPQEVETILCKWKSYMGGHYWVGKDIKEHREALHGWGRTAERILAAYPPLVE